MFYQIKNDKVIGMGTRWSTGFVEIDKRMGIGDSWNGEVHTPLEVAVDEVGAELPVKPWKE